MNSDYSLAQAANLQNLAMCRIFASELFCTVFRTWMTESGRRLSFGHGLNRYCGHYPAQAKAGVAEPLQNPFN
jgi:hypothetical protein